MARRPRRKAPLILGDQHRIERAVPVTGDARAFTSVGDLLRQIERDRALPAQAIRALQSLRDRRGASAEGVALPMTSRAPSIWRRLAATCLAW